MDAIWATICPLSLASSEASARVHCSNTYFAGAGGVFVEHTLFNTNDTLSTALTYANLRGVHGSTNRDVYAVGDDGTILRNDGNAWSLSTSGFSENLHDVFVVSSLDIFVVGDGGRILRGADGTWTPMASGVGTSLRGVWAENSSYVFAVGDAGTILRFDGVDWNPEVAPGFAYTDVWGFPSSEPIAVALGGVIAMRNAGTWSAMTDPVSTDLFGVWGTSATNAYAVGANGVILHLDDSGVWESMVSGVSDDIVAVSGANETVWVVTQGGIALRRDGASWRIEESPPIAGYGAVQVQSGRVFAAGTRGGIVRFVLQP